MTCVPPGELLRWLMPEHYQQPICSTCRRASQRRRWLTARHHRPRFAGIDARIVPFGPTAFKEGGTMHIRARFAGLILASGLMLAPASAQDASRYPLLI